MYTTVKHLGGNTIDCVEGRDGGNTCAVCMSEKTFRKKEEKKIKKNNNDSKRVLNLSILSKENYS